MIVEVRIFKPIFLWFSKSKLEREFPELFKTHLTFISTAIFPGVMAYSNTGLFFGTPCIFTSLRSHINCFMEWFYPILNDYTLHCAFFPVHSPRDSLGWLLCSRQWPPWPWPSGQRRACWRHHQGTPPRETLWLGWSFCSAAVSQQCWVWIQWALKFHFGLNNP